MNEQELSNESDEQSKKQGYDDIKMGGGATNFRPWLFKKGTSGNPKGRVKGAKSLKTFVKEYLEKLPDKEKIDFMDGMPKDILWRMGEGQPHQTSETDVKGKIVLEFAKEFNKKKDKKE